MYFHFRICFGIAPMSDEMVTDCNCGNFDYITGIALEDLEFVPESDDARYRLNCHNVSI